MEGGGGSEPPSDLGDSILSEMCKDFLGIEQEASLAAGQAAIMGEPLLLPGTDAEPKAPGFPKQAPPHPGRSGVYRTMDDMATDVALTPTGATSTTREKERRWTCPP